MASAKIVAGDHANSKKLVSVYIRVVHNRKKADIPIKGLKITATNWSDETYIRKAEPTILNVSNTNIQLKMYDLKALQTINRLASDNTLTSMSLNDLVNEISLACFNNTSNIRHTFGSYTDSIIEQLEQAKKYGNAKCYADAKSFVIRRMGRDIQFSELTSNALMKMEALHYGANKGVNCLGYYMRTIRAIYNRAVKDKIVTKDYSPFNNYKIKHEQTAKRAISLDDFIKMKQAVIDPQKTEFHTQKMFLFSFYTRGMNFMDMAHLKLSDIVDDRITYKRAKTHKHFTVAIIPQAREILDFYIVGKKATDFVFPIFKNPKASDKELREEIENERRNFNKRLDRIAKTAKISTGITSYVIRHSWATISKYAGLSVELISEGMGHANTKTTEIYLASFPNEVMDKASLLVANLLDNPSK
jgi:integrase/recombinase XerD